MRLQISGTLFEVSSIRFHLHNNDKIKICYTYLDGEEDSFYYECGSDIDRVMVVRRIRLFILRNGFYNFDNFEEMWKKRRFKDLFFLHKFLSED